MSLVSDTPGLIDKTAEPARRAITAMRIVSDELNKGTLQTVTTQHLTRWFDVDLSQGADAAFMRRLRRVLHWAYIALNTWTINLTSNTPYSDPNVSLDDYASVVPPVVNGTQLTWGKVQQSVNVDAPMADQLQVSINGSTVALSGNKVRVNMDINNQYDRANSYEQTQTFVHEMSHAFGNTDDVGGGYGYNEALALNTANKRKNADNWGYFCVDLAKALGPNLSDNTDKQTIAGIGNRT